MHPPLLMLVLLTFRWGWSRTTCQLCRDCLPPGAASACRHRLAFAVSHDLGDVVIAEPQVLAEERAGDRAPRRAKDWWHQYSGAIPEWFQFYVGLEAATSAMVEHNAELVTGLLQTEPYVRAVMIAALWTDSDDMERQIAVRMERQKRLTAADAPTLWVVLNEGALHRQVGGPTVMREQLGHIADVATLPNVTIQVLPSPPARIQRCSDRSR
jgi:hypothetical protein